MQQIICRHVQSINPTYLLFCCYFFLNAYEFKIGKEKTKRQDRIWISAWKLLWITRQSLISLNIAKYKTIFAHQFYIYYKGELPAIEECVQIFQCIEAIGLRSWSFDKIRLTGRTQLSVSFEHSSFNNFICLLL